MGEVVGRVRIAVRASRAAARPAAAGDARRRTDPEHQPLAEPGLPASPWWCGTSARRAPPRRPAARTARVEPLGRPAAVVVVLPAQGVEALPDVERVEVAGPLEVVEERPARRRVGHGDQVGEERDLEGRVVEQHPGMPVEPVAGLEEDPVEAVDSRSGSVRQARPRLNGPRPIGDEVVHRDRGLIGRRPRPARRAAAPVSRTRSITPTMSPTVASGLSRVTLRNCRPSTLVAATIARPRCVERGADVVVERAIAPSSALSAPAGRSGTPACSAPAGAATSRSGSSLHRDVDVAGEVDHGVDVPRRSRRVPSSAASATA